MRNALGAVTQAVTGTHEVFNAQRGNVALAQAARVLRVGADWRDGGVLERVVEVFSRYGATQGRLPAKRALFRAACEALHDDETRGLARALEDEPLQVWWVERATSVGQARRFRALLGPHSAQADWLHGLFTDSPEPMRESGALWGVRICWEERSYLVCWAEVPGSLLALLREEGARWAQEATRGDFARAFETQLARRVADPYAELPLWGRVSWYRAMRPSREGLNQRVVNALQRRLGVGGVLELRLALSELVTPASVEAFQALAKASGEDVLLEFAEYDALEVDEALALQELGWSRDRTERHLAQLRREPVVLLGLAPEVLEGLGVERSDTIAAALSAAREAREDIRQAIEEAFACFAREQRWVDMSGLAFETDDVAPVGPFYTRLDYLYEMRSAMDVAFWSLPFSQVALGAREQKRVERALCAAIGGDETLLMGHLPHRQVDLLRLKNVGASTLEVFREAMLRSARDWRWRQAGLERRVLAVPLVDDQTHREASDEAHEGLEDLLALFETD